MAAATITWDHSDHRYSVGTVTITNSTDNRCEAILPDPADGTFIPSIIQAVPQGSSTQYTSLRWHTESPVNATIGIEFGDSTIGSWKNPVINTTATYANTEPGYMTATTGPWAAGVFLVAAGGASPASIAVKIYAWR